MTQCPRCGAFKVAPHCTDLACQHRWCTKGECGWDNGLDHYGTSLDEVNRLNAELDEILSVVEV